MISKNSIKALASAIRNQRELRGTGTDGTSRALAQQAVVENIAVDLWDTVLFHESPASFSRAQWFTLCAVQDPLVPVRIVSTRPNVANKPKARMGRLTGLASKPKAKQHVKR